jgi:hypothetical protein
MSHMEVAVGKNRYWRTAVMAVICIIHGALIVVLLRAKPAYLTAPAPALLATVFFIDPEPRRVLVPSISSRLAPRSLDMEPFPALPPESSAITMERGPAPEDDKPSTPPTIDWLAEAHRSAAGIVGGNAPDKAGATSPPRIAPWDPHPQALETTGHGLKLRIIDPCFADVDLGQTVYGSEARLQLGCTLGKKAPRGDIFDSISKPRPNE